MATALQKRTITREHLAKSISRVTQIKLIDAYHCVDKIINLTTSALINSTPIKIRLFGSFNIKQKKARIGRNPKTKVEAIIQPRKVVQFKVAANFKNNINANVDSICKSK